MSSRPKPASNSERTSLWHNAERFYELALSHVRDDENAARAQRGLAELNRLVKDYVSAYSNYEALLSRFPRSDAAKNCEVLLADMYVKAGEKASAQTLLRQFLDRCTDHDVREEAPDADETISYRMPAFMQGGALIYFAAFRKHIGIYPPVHGDAALLDALAPYRGPKGNLSFPLDQPMPYELIRRVARQRVQENASKAQGRGKK